MTTAKTKKTKSSPSPERVFSAINIKMQREDYDRMQQIMEKLHGANANNFANGCIVAAMDMIESEDLELPHFLEAARSSVKIYSRPKVKISERASD